MTTAKPFKSERSAKIAMTKATAAYEAAHVKAGSHYRNTMQDPNCQKSWEEVRQECRDLEAISDARFQEMKAVYDQARAQNFWVRCWYLDSNPTRDLIAANID